MSEGARGSAAPRFTAPQHGRMLAGGHPAGRGVSVWLIGRPAPARTGGCYHVLLPGATACTSGRRGGVAGWLGFAGRCHPMVFKSVYA